ncbi:hypothetical protein RZS08_33685 [Arthrospira platensis SPKY1]|nr:hypothetical protein [Arthrospira platensis SPKY1]
MLWPGHAWFGSAQPLIFGLPLSFAWIIAWVLIGFAALLGLHRARRHNQQPSSDA